MSITITLTQGRLLQTTLHLQSTGATRLSATSTPLCPDSYVLADAGGQYRQQEFRSPEGAITWLDVPVIDQFGRTRTTQPLPPQSSNTTQE